MRPMTPSIPVTVDTFEMRRPNASPKVTTVLRFATTTPLVHVTVDTCETRRPHASPKVTTVLHFATNDPSIPVTVDTFEMRRPNASPKVMTVLRFVTIFGADACEHTAGACEHTADACEHTANACERSARILRQLPTPRPPTSTREPFCCAFGKRQFFNLCARSGRRLAAHPALGTEDTMVAVEPY